MKRLMVDEVIVPSKMQRTTYPETVKVTTTSTPLQSTISLTSKESQLFEFLLDVVKQYQCNVVLRVAGGWVRDKLLGRESDDIDIVLDTMTGKDFADLINTYETDHGHKKHPVGIIKANPDQSKHLETATMQLGEVGWVDFVNLRAETYSEEHRIPEVVFGTPLQDAQRRDFTMNSLFYNITKHEIEDFNQQGIEDLRKGILRTPLDARVTFLDDPLRVLRAVRFASRFNFELEDSLQAAALSDDVKQALIKKISRERVGKEILGMLNGSSAHPERAIQLLHRLQLLQCIFLPPLPPTYELESPIDLRMNNVNGNIDLWKKGYAYAAAMYNLIADRSVNHVLDVDALNEDDQNSVKLRILAALLLPFADIKVIIKQRPHCLPLIILKESLKLRNRDAEDVGNVILCHVASLREQTQLQTFDRVNAGLLLRTIGPLWKLCSDVVLIYGLVLASDSKEKQESIRTQHNAFATAVTAHGLDGVWDMKPLLNGKELIKELGIKPGPAVKLMLDQIIRWQLEHPQATRDECLEHFRTANDSL